VSRGSFFAGQLAGTEGYIENITSGLVAGINAVQLLKGSDPIRFPVETAIGSLCRYISTPTKHFAPMNIHFGSSINGFAESGRPRPRNSECSLSAP
jgi:folate-dependent tRNA-U54 methylase TrmFO/GidA